MRNPRGVGGVGGWGRSLTPHTPHTPLPLKPTLCVRNPGYGDLATRSVTIEEVLSG
ncbi:MAG: hypothetical protein V7K71_22160 [Nostoc sp.]|uniref:hypothetical protein n=1 Tax=Nostoc sp. TaxID=1180 RepID=UPI002FF479D9